MSENDVPEDLVDEHDQDDAVPGDQSPEALGERETITEETDDESDEDQIYEDDQADPEEATEDVSPQED